MLPFCFAKIEFANFSLGKKPAAFVSSALLLFLFCPVSFAYSTGFCFPPIPPSISVTERGTCWWMFRVWTAEHLATGMQVPRTLEEGPSFKTNKKNMCKLQMRAWVLELRCFCVQDNKEMWVPCKSGTEQSAGQSISGKFLHLHNGFCICWPKWVYYILFSYGTQFSRITKGFIQMVPKVITSHYGEMKL